MQVFLRIPAGVLLLFLLLSTAAHAKDNEESGLRALLGGKLKLRQHGYGAVLGVQRGQYTFIEIGTEYYWRKIRLVKPQTYTLGTNFSYNFGHNVLGYRVYGYYRQGRINITYGGGINYVTDFSYSRFGISPQLGFRLMGFHLATGINLLAGNKEMKNYNLFFIGLNYYFPVDRKLKLKKG